MQSNFSVTISTQNPKNAQVLLDLMAKLPKDTEETTTASAPTKGTTGKKNTKPAVTEEEETTEEMTGTSDDDGFDLGGEEEEEAEPAMTIEDLRKGLKAVNKPEAIMGLITKKFKVKKLTDLKPEQYADVLAQAKKLK